MDYKFLYIWIFRIWINFYVDGPIRIGGVFPIMLCHVENWKSKHHTVIKASYHQWTRDMFNPQWLCVGEHKYCVRGAKILMNYQLKLFTFIYIYSCYQRAIACRLQLSFALFWMNIPINYYYYRIDLLISVK